MYLKLNKKINQSSTMEYPNTLTLFHIKGVQPFPVVQIFEPYHTEFFCVVVFILSACM